MVHRLQPTGLSYAGMLYVSVSVAVQRATAVPQAQLRSGEGLQDVLCSYERLWRKMRGEFV